MNIDSNINIIIHIWIMCFNLQSQSRLAVTLCVCVQAHLLPVQPRGGAGQRPGTPPRVFWGGCELRGHQGGVQMSSKPRGRVSVHLLQDSDWRPVPQLALSALGPRGAGVKKVAARSSAPRFKMFAEARRVTVGRVASFSSVLTTPRWGHKSCQRLQTSTKMSSQIQTCVYV